MAIEETKGNHDLSFQVSSREVLSCSITLSHTCIVFASIESDEDIGICPSILLVPGFHFHRVCC